MHTAYRSVSDVISLFFQVNPAASIGEHSCLGGIRSATTPLMISFATFLHSNPLQSRSARSLSRFVNHVLSHRGSGWLMKHASGKEGGFQEFVRCADLISVAKLVCRVAQVGRMQWGKQCNMVFPWDARWRTTDREVCTFSWALSHLLIRHAIPSVSSVPPQKWNQFKKRKRLHEVT